MGIEPAPHGLFFLPTHDLSGSDQVDKGLGMIPVVPNIFFPISNTTLKTMHSSATVIIKQGQPPVKQYHYRHFNYNGGNRMMGQWVSTSVITLKLEALAFPFFNTKHFS